MQETCDNWKDLEKPAVRLAGQVCHARVRVFATLDRHRNLLVLERVAAAVTNSL